ncbi:MAG: sulfite exporter TauE/SafE family protein [Telmatospirillum sp.]|nr:sulfite exporter TauE/SafE family protein [Telmatospirillum sp.]
MTTLSIAVIVFFSYFVQSAFGFGAGILAIPMLSLFMDAKDAITVVMLFSFLCGLLILASWRDIDWPNTRRLIPGLALGVIAGLILFSIIDRRFLGACLAAYIILYVLVDHFKPPSLLALGHSTPAVVQALMCGFAGGLVQGVMGTGGPMLVTFLKSHTRSVDQFRASVVCVFFIANTMRVAVMGAGEMIPRALLLECAWALPFFGAALFLGWRLPRKIDSHLFHAAINLLLLASGITILFKQVF